MSDATAGRLRPHGRNLWIADGPAVRFLGFVPYPTRMAVARFADGGLWVWSPIELDGELGEEVDALGPVRHLVAPNGLHHLSLGQWKARYPAARLFAAPGLVEKRRDLDFDAQLGDAPEPSWKGEVDHVIFHGTFFWEEVVFFHRASGTALVCDLIQRFAPDYFSGPTRWMMRFWGLVGPNGSTPREWRASFWKRRAARHALETALAWNAARLVIAHGELPTENGREALARGLRWLG